MTALTGPAARPRPGLIEAGGTYQRLWEASR